MLKKTTLLNSRTALQLGGLIGALRTAQAGRTLSTRTLGIHPAFARSTLKLIFSILMIGFGTVAAAQAAAPTIFFSDLESAPKTGGENNNGAFVTLYGNNFGTSPTVTVGGGQALIKLQPSNYLWYQKMTVQLGPNAATGNIVVTNSNGSSNGLPFTVRSGNIYFAGSQSGDQPSIVACKNALAAGDICYVRDGLSATSVENYTANIVLGALGTATMPRALVVYPGASATIGTLSSARGVYACSGYSSCPNGSYWVVAGFNLRGITAGDLINVSNISMVGNDFYCPQGTGRTACLEVENSSYSRILGNYHHESGVSPTDKYYHRLYFSDSSSHHEVAWNEITGGYANRGIQFYTSGDPTYDLSVHDNYIHNIVGDGINFATVNAGSGKVEAYNNLIVSVGKGPDPSNGSSNYACFMIDGINSGTVEIYNNTMYDCGSRRGSAAGGIGAGVNTRLRNNIMYQIGSEVYLESEYGDSMISGSNNLWYGVGNGPSQTTGNINANPQFVSVGSNFQLSASSPAINMGTTISTLTMDMNGNYRPQGSGYEIGAYEYGSSSTPVTISVPTNLRVLQ